MTNSDLDRISTEARNPRTLDLDLLPTDELLLAMNDEDRQVAFVVQTALKSIGTAVDAIALRMERGGRLIYCGAGTSGRLGVLDAAECEPTFSSRPGQVIGLIAGGPSAMLRAVEGAEDSAALGEHDLRALSLTKDDCVVGIAASGRTPYVLGALAYANATGAFTAGVVCSADSAVAAAAQCPIEVVTGPEVLTGSTRLKAGTATKLVLNMISTAAFIRLHKVYGNLMVDVQPTNQKLVERTIRIVATAANVAREVAAKALQTCGFEAKTAIVVLCAAVEPEVARARLLAGNGSVRRALEAR